MAICPNVRLVCLGLVYILWMVPRMVQSLVLSVVLLIASSSISGSMSDRGFLVCCRSGHLDRKWSSSSTSRRNISWHRGQCLLLASMGCCLYLPVMSLLLGRRRCLLAWPRFSYCLLEKCVYLLKLCTICRYVCIPNFVLVCERN